MHTFRIAVSGLVAAAVAMAALRFADLDAAESPWPVTGLYLLLALYAAALAAFVAWKLPGRSDARFLALSFGATALTLATAVTPSGIAEPVARVAMAVGSTAALAFAILFASRFPRRLDASDFQVRPPSTSRVARYADATLEPFARMFFTRRWLVWSWLMLCSVLFYRTAAPDVAYRYNLVYLSADSPLLWMALPRGLAFLVCAMFVVALVWTGYRRAEQRPRRQAQWFVLGGVFSLCWALLMIVVHAVGFSTDWEPLRALGSAASQVSMQVIYFVGITAPFFALLFGGAMDLKPVIRKTSLYGVTLVALTVLFAGVEQFVSSQLTERLNLPDGAGSWLGAVAVALAMMPMQDRIKAFLGRFGGAETEGDSLREEG